MVNLKVYTPAYLSVFAPSHFMLKIPPEAGQGGSECLAEGCFKLQPICLLICSTFLFEDVFARVLFYLGGVFAGKASYTEIASVQRVHGEHPG